jgi:hypothetical protein
LPLSEPPNSGGALAPPAPHYLRRCMLATHPKRRWPFVSKAVSMSCTLGLLVYAYCAQSKRHRPAAVMLVAAAVAVLRPCGTGVVAAHRPFCYAMRPCEGRRAKTQGRSIDETASDKGSVSMGAMGVLIAQKLRTFCVAPMNFEIPSPKVYTTPITAMGCRQCLPLSII